MSFSFGFADTDFSDDELDVTSVKHTVTDSTKPSDVCPLDSDKLTDKSVVQASFVTLSQLLDSLVNVRLSFEEIASPESNFVLYRRELFDVKHQLMSEVDSNTESVELKILMGETNEDLRPNVYEGGLKSWECSIDLVDSLMQNPIPNFECDSIIELGCGTSLPSQSLFVHYLKSNKSSGIRITLCDYNHSVLRLVTVPNLLISWAKTVLSEEQWKQLQLSEDPNVPITPDELLLTKRLIETFKADLSARGIQLSFIAGSWGRKFVNVLSEQKLMPHPNTLILTAETIYQPDMLPVLTETLIELIMSNKKASCPVKSLVAAKDIYFGVGGSIAEFESYLTKRIQKNNLPIDFQKFKVNAGLKRSIIFIE